MSGESSSATHWCPRCSRAFAGFHAMVEHARDAHRVQIRSSFGTVS